MSNQARILLIRHGETELNAKRVLQPPETPLSERGVAQAERLARRLETDPALGSGDQGDPARLVPDVVFTPIFSHGATILHNEQLVNHHRIFAAFSG